MFNHQKDLRFMLMGYFPQWYTNENILSELEELDSLIKTYGGQSFALIAQKGRNPHFETYLGSGKIQQAADLIVKNKINIVVVNDVLRPKQLYSLEKIFQKENPNILIWDKIYLILHIFDLHAQTADSKLQLKIAGLKHMGPKIFGMGYVLSRQAGGIGTRGIGETNTEIMKRHWRQEIYAIKKKIRELEKNRLQQIDRRKKLGLITVSIVGYTNSGKTTLFNTLTKKDKYVVDKLFATLDSFSGKLFLPNQAKSVILTDTIGFIRNLPPSLLDSFKSTLMESINSDLILHLIDVSDKEMFVKIKTVEEILNELNLQESKKMYVFNKIDKIQNIDKSKIRDMYKKYSPVFISAKNKTGIEELIIKIENFFN